MKDKISDGGQAFPTAQLEYNEGNILLFQLQGMTLRDFFAGLALSGMYAGETEDYGIPDKNKAEIAYKAADAMLAAREAA